MDGRDVNLCRRWLVLWMMLLSCVTNGLYYGGHVSQLYRDWILTLAVAILDGIIAPLWKCKKAKVPYFELAPQQLTRQVKRSRYNLNGHYMFSQLMSEARIFRIRIPGLI
jgi:hypothetical protein